MAAATSRTWSLRESETYTFPGGIDGQHGRVVQQYRAGRAAVAGVVGLLRDLGDGLDVPRGHCGPVEGSALSLQTSPCPPVDHRSGGGPAIAHGW